MSIAFPEVLDSSTTFDTTFARPKRKAAKPREYPSRVRLPNKTQWALRDMLASAQRGRGFMEALAGWIKCERLDAKGRYDTARLDRLGELSRILCELALDVAALERLASDARIGVYEPTAHHP